MLLETIVSSYIGKTRIFCVIAPRYFIDFQFNNFVEAHKMKRSICLLAALSMVTLFVFSGCAAKPAAVVLTPAEVLTKSYDNMQAVKSFHFLLDHTGGGTPISSGIQMTKAEGDLVKPDKLQTTITGTFMGSTIEVSLVTADETTLMTNPLTGKWEVVPATFEVLSIFDPGTGIAAIIKGLTNPSDLGDEKVGEVLCYHLKGDITSETLKPFTGTTAEGVLISTEVWIDKEDMLVQQVKLTGKITDTETDGIVRTLLFTNYNKDVAITLPEQG